MIYNKKLIDLKEEKNLKQYKLAELLNIKPSTYNNYETEYEIIPIKHLNTLCNYFDVSFDFIFELSNVKSYVGNKKVINAKFSGKRLREIRKEIGISQQTLAKILNINQTTISKCELGKKVITTTYLYTICKKYNISADYLLGKIDTPKYLNSTKK